VIHHHLLGACPHQGGSPLVLQYRWIGLLQSLRQHSLHERISARIADNSRSGVSGSGSFIAIGLPMPGMEVPSAFRGLLRGGQRVAG
jgi:hypothetical protein